MWQHNREQSADYTKASRRHVGTGNDGEPAYSLSVNSPISVMSRALPQPPLSSLPLSALLAQTNFAEGTTDRTPKEWFDRARHEADLAVIAERKGRKEEVFVAYSRCCGAYANVKMHSDFKEVKKADAHWAGRVKDFQDVSKAERNRS